MVDGPSDIQADLRLWFGEEPSGPLAGCSVFLADDSEDNRRLLARLLERDDARVSSFADGSELLRAVLEGPGEADLVILDLEMPGLGGLETVRRLRACGIELPVVALTGHRDEVRLQEAFEAGFDEVWTKPIDPASLLRRVAERLAA